MSTAADGVSSQKCAGRRAFVCIRATIRFSATESRAIFAMFCAKAPFGPGMACATMFFRVRRRVGVPTNYTGNAIWPVWKSIMAADRKYIYGPVPSRRLGRSLGIDLVPFKICAYDCIYCQLGRTTRKTWKRRAYFPVNEIQAELEQVLNTGETPDCIGIAGSGEPTLNSGIGVLIKDIKRRTAIPVAVLTNGALLWMPAVRAALMPADLVLPSLDAGDSRLFRRINRPCSGITYDRMVKGLIQFTHQFPGQVWLEILLLAGLTDTPAAVTGIAEQVSRIQPSRVQLNTVCRPPAEKYARPIAIEEMLALKAYFTGPVDIIGEIPAGRVPMTAAGAAGDREILAMLGRRPCTAEDVAGGLRMHLNEALKKLEQLVAAGAARTLLDEKKIFYTAAGPSGPAAQGRMGSIH
jgi:wyosine [tRNA(Phe)-imidazoG37] synthetase (radical SAM superfamily)